MPTYYPSLSSELKTWALAQPVFFTATAPTFGSHINVSPKGLTTASFAVLSPNSCAYLDATGSGCETAAHLRNNGRITLMWLSFGTSPRIMRLFGTGRVIERGGTSAQGSPEYEDAVQRMRTANGGHLDALPVQKGKGQDSAKLWRGVIEIHFFKVQTSCGFGVPVMTGLPANKAERADEEKGVARAPGGADDAAPPASKTTETARPPSPSTNLDEIRASVAKTHAAESASVAASLAATDSADVGTTDARTAVYRGPPYTVRPTLANAMAGWGRGNGTSGSVYQAKNNAVSLDGLPGYRSARRTRLTRGSVRERARNAGELAMINGRVAVRRLWGAREGMLMGLLLGWVLGLMTALGTRGAIEWMSIWCEAVMEWARR